ncbi:predicted protein [Aspergillus terreus NIH2624]|uniref:BZIP domain-containing protein n=1 Tax=Aspergillus terreus (strain NIH 2624 / FGSC A1156) TaxID=341663 RepID=Q0CZM1_ASPTN|nr:uncharacterized protein ATEG_00863 [Aspergillus terreus NIH2624]EAU39509.1 predicted protein [Aspergillus terreus NIH2624]
MSPQPESSQPKKRESRAGTRKVTSLSAEQLERKRANDREAQRTIRQRTREHIERLEHQVAELKAKGEQYDDVVRRNAVLENEIRALRHQLALLSGRPDYGQMDADYSSRAEPYVLEGQIRTQNPIPLATPQVEFHGTQSVRITSGSKHRLYADTLRHFLHLCESPIHKVDTGAFAAGALILLED